MNDQVRELWRNVDFRKMFTSRVVSNFGNGMTPIALAFGVLDLPGGNAGSLSIVTAAHMVPLVLFMVIGGVAADRFGRALLVGGSDLLGSIFVSISALAFLTGYASVPLLAFNAFVFGVLNALWYPAFTGLMPQIVETRLLQSANALVGMGANLALTLGAATAGFLVAAFGSGWAIMIDALSFFIAGCLVFSLRHLDRDAPTDEEKNVGIITQLKDGWVEFSSRRWIVIIVVSFAFFHPAFEGFIGVMAPVRAKEVLNGARDMGFMMAGWGFGGLLGTLAALRIHVKRPLLLAVGVMPTISFWIFSMAVPMPIWFLVLTAVISGIAIDVMYANWLTTLQTYVPEEAMSRVGAYDAFGSMIFAPMGLFVAGPFTKWVGTQTALVVAGTVALVAASVPLLSREVRTLTRADQ
jgi:MFS family permease